MNIKESEFPKSFDVLEIYDCFVNQDGDCLYLLSDGKKALWYKEDSISKQKLDQFVSSWNFQEEPSTNLNCRVRKDTDHCIKKCRTKGVLLGVFNCGIIGAFKELFCSESLS